MKLVKKNNWNNTHTYLFYLFLLSIPFQTRKVFLTEYSFYSGAFTEYATFFIYASDILLSLTLICWFIFNKKKYKHFNIKNLKSARKLPVVWLLLLAFIFWLIISAVINNNYTEISIFQTLKFIELSFLIIYIYFNLKDKKRLITAFFVIAFAGFFQGLIAIYQFVYQCPLFKHPFLHRLTGESTVYPQVSGIAKIIVDNEKLVRAYGTFPHPNLLGCFLIVSIFISIYLLKHKSYILSRLSFRYNNTNNNKSQVKYLSSLLSLFWIVFIFTQITALLFTFSRSAWAGFLVSLFLIGIFYARRFLIVSRETIKKNNSKNNIAKLVIVRQAHYDKFSVFAILRQIQNNTIVKFCNFRENKKLLFVFKKNKDANLKIINTNPDNKIVSRETIEDGESRCAYRNEQACLFVTILIIVLLTLILIITYSSHINNRINRELSINNSLSSDYLPSNYALSDRIFYNNVSRETISDNFMFGSGPGTFIFQIDDYLIRNNIHQKLEPWQYQPAHNIYLLIISEIGIIGFIIFSLFIIKIIACSFKIIKKPLNKRFSLNSSPDNISIVSRETMSVNSKQELNYYLLSIFIAFLFIGLFDHYFWTLQQGKLMFWLVLGLILVNNKNKSQ